MCFFPFYYQMLILQSLVSVSTSICFSFPRGRALYDYCNIGIFVDSILPRCQVHDCNLHNLGVKGGQVLYCIHNPRCGTICQRQNVAVCAFACMWDVMGQFMYFLLVKSRTVKQFSYMIFVHKYIMIICLLHFM